MGHPAAAFAELAGSRSRKIQDAARLLVLLQALPLANRAGMGSPAGSTTTAPLTPGSLPSNPYPSGSPTPPSDNGELHPDQSRGGAEQTKWGWVRRQAPRGSVEWLSWSLPKSPPRAMRGGPAPFVCGGGCRSLQI